MKKQLLHESMCSSCFYFIRLCFWRVCPLRHPWTMPCLTKAGALSENESVCGECESFPLWMDWHR